MSLERSFSAKALPRRRWIWISLQITVLSVCGAHAILQFWGVDTSDFIHFYRAATAMSKGEDIYLAAQGHYIYPPLLAFIFQPLTLLLEPMAATVWTIINCALIFAATSLASKEAVSRWLTVNSETYPHLSAMIAAIATCLAADKIHATLVLGQTDSLMLLAFACVLRWMDRKPILAGLAIGFSANVKYLTLICVPYFLFKRKYKAAISAIVAFAFFLFIPVVEIGSQNIAKYLASSIGGLGRLVTNTQRPVNIFQVTWDRSISLTSAVFRFAHSNGLSDSAAVALVAILFGCVITAITLIARGQGVPLFRPAQTEGTSSQDRPIHIEWAVIIFLAVVFSPQSTARHMLLLLLIYTVAMVIFVSCDSAIQRVWLGGVLALVVSSLSLPFWTIGMAQHRGQWRAISGASWCAFILILAVVSTGTRTIAEMSRRNAASDVTAREAPSESSS